MGAFDIVALGLGTMARIEASGGVITLIDVYALGGAPTSDLSVKLHAQGSGQVIFDLVASTARFRMNGYDTLLFTAGATHFVGAVEADGILTVDGSLIANGSFIHLGNTLGFFSIPSVTRATAYTQTYATATKTHSAPTATVLTAATGTADGTVQDVSGSFDQTILNNNFKDVATAINALIVDVANVKQIANSIIDDLQAYGLLA